LHSYDINIWKDKHVTITQLVILVHAWVNREIHIITSYHLLLIKIKL